MLAHYISALLLFRGFLGVSDSSSTSYQLYFIPYTGGVGNLLGSCFPVGSAQSLRQGQTLWDVHSVQIGVGKYK